VVVLDVDSTIVVAHSDKEGAAATYKHTYGFHPILVTCNNTGELLTIKLRPGNAGANTAADHLDVLGEAFAQVPAAHRRHLLVRGDSAAATHAVLDWLTAQDSKRGRRVEYSIGWSIEAERAAITALPASAWSPAINADGGVRDGAQVAELTGLLGLSGWPAGTRVIAPVGRFEIGAGYLAAQHRYLMAEHQDLHILGPIVAGELGQHLQDLAKQQVHQRRAHGHEHDGCAGLELAQNRTSDGRTEYSSPTPTAW
jgi:hypothetical protein